MGVFDIFRKLRKAKDETKQEKNAKSKGSPPKEGDDTPESHKDKLSNVHQKQQSLKQKRLKKSKRDKIREKKNRNSDYEMFRGILGDRDYRTRQGIVGALLLILAVVIFVFSVGYVIVGTAKYKTFQKNNTTPIGEELKFRKSGASVKFGGAWTDKKRNVTVVKLKYDKQARNMLSTQGSNYKIYVVDKKKKLKNKVKMSYGILGTEGDGFLFIKGDWDKQAYNIFITNELNMTTGSSSELVTGNNNGGSSATEKLAREDVDELTTSELESSLSEVENNNGSKSGRFNFGDDSNKPNVDYIDFRVNSYSKSTKVYNGSFLTSNGDIDYSKVIDTSSVEHVIKSVDKDIKKAKAKNKQYDDSIEEFKKRVERNKEDEDSKSNIKSLEKKKEENEETIRRLEKLKELYQNEDFDKSSFGDMSEGFKSIRPKE